MNTDSLYVSVTPAGCFYAIENTRMTSERRLLKQFLALPDAVLLSTLCDNSTGSPSLIDYDDLQQLESAGFVAVQPKQSHIPQGQLSTMLPRLLPELSQRGSVVLADARQGLPVDFVGVSQDDAAEMSVMAAQFQEIADRRNKLVGGQLGFSSSAVAMVDPAGSSELGFWPLHIDSEIFTLAVLGIPRFNTLPFAQLIWALVVRYSDSSDTLLHVDSNSSRTQF